MKKHSSGLFKQALSLFMAILKSKSMAAKSKAGAVKTRFIIFKLLHDKNALIGVFPRKKNERPFGEERMIYCDKATLRDDDDDEPDECVKEKQDELRHDVEFVREFGEIGEEFEYEGEVDRAADVFIRRFHEEMKMQRQESFKVYREMLAKGV